MTHRRIALAAPILLSLVASCATPAAAPADGTADGASDGASTTETATPAFVIIVLEHADATEMASTLQDFIDDATAGADQESETKVLADTRTNSLLVMAPTERMAQVKTLVARLDTKD